MAQELRCLGNLHTVNVDVDDGKVAKQRLNNRTVNGVYISVLSLPEDNNLKMIKLLVFWRMSSGSNNFSFCCLDLSCFCAFGRRT